MPYANHKQAYVKIDFLLRYIKGMHNIHPFNHPHQEQHQNCFRKSQISHALKPRNRQCWKACWQFNTSENHIHSLHYKCFQKWQCWYYCGYYYSAFDFCSTGLLSGNYFRLGWVCQMRMFGILNLQYGFY